MDIYELFHRVQRQTSWSGKDERIPFSKYSGEAAEDEDEFSAATTGAGGVATTGGVVCHSVPRNSVGRRGTHCYPFAFADSDRSAQQDFVQVSTFCSCRSAAHMTSGFSRLVAVAKGPAHRPDVVEDRSRSLHHLPHTWSKDDRILPHNAHIWSAKR